MLFVFSMKFQFLCIIYYGVYKQVYKSFSGVHLDVVRSQDDPATEAVSQIDDGHAAAEPDHIGERCSKCHDQDLREAPRHETYERKTLEKKKGRGSGDFINRIH